MLDWDKVKKDKALLKKVEKIVDDVAEIYYDFPDDICDELNRLTGNDWDGDEYIEYCAEYWESSDGLESVVYALFHDGEYPNIIEKELEFIRPHDKSVLPTRDVRHKLCTAKPDDSYREQFEPLPADKIEEWFTKRFAGWEKSVQKKEDKFGKSDFDYGKTSFHFEYKGDREYGFEKYISIFLSNDKTGFINSQNLTPEEWNDVLNYFKNDGSYTFIEK